MKVTEADMASRKRMAALDSDITDAIGKHPNITYAELLAVLADTTRRWAGHMLRDERDEENGGTH